MKETFGSIMARNRGIGPGFDFLRLALALSVLVFHAFQLPYGREAMNRMVTGPVSILVATIVPAFFALSGFLVAGSMIRVKRISTFLLFRALRIAPALMAEIFLSALILGTMTTTLPLSDYFASPKFWGYFTNLVGWMKYSLPGVFLDNPLPDTVNGQLWTVPAELHCYVALAVLMFLRIAEKRRLMLAAFLVASAFECTTVVRATKPFGWNVVFSQEMLILCFMCGNLFYLWRDRIPSSAALFVAAIAGFGLVVYVSPALSFVLGTASVTYFIVYLGMHRLVRVPVLLRGDYSYGIYLYSFPIQQAVVWALPGSRQWYVNLLIAGPAAILFAMGSWHFLEKPALGLRHRFGRAVGRTETGKEVIEGDVKREGEAAPAALGKAG